MSLYRMQGRGKDYSPLAEEPDPFPVMSDDLLQHRVHLGLPDRHPEYSRRRTALDDVPPPTMVRRRH